jgi:hypothetical protein
LVFLFADSRQARDAMTIIRITSGRMTPSKMAISRMTFLKKSLFYYFQLLVFLFADSRRAGGTMTIIRKASGRMATSRMTIIGITFSQKVQSFIISSFWFSCSQIPGRLEVP